MLGAGPWLGPRRPGALPVVIAGLAAQRLGGRRRRDPDARHFHVCAGKLLLERRVGPLEVVAQVLLVVADDRLARRAAVARDRRRALPSDQARAMWPRRPA